MQRVTVALLLVAAAFAVLVLELELGRGDHQAALFVFAGILAGGLPLLYLCCKRRWWDLWQSCLLGTLGGILCALPFSGGDFGLGFLLAIFIVAGILLGIVFWLVAVWRNDNLTCPKAFCLPCGTAYRFARNALRRGGPPQSK